MDSQYYKSNSANPFYQSSEGSEWDSNALVLKESDLRHKSGVNVLDSNVSEVFKLVEQHLQQDWKNMNGGAASGAPYHISNFGASNSVNTHLVQASQELDSYSTLEGQASLVPHGRCHTDTQLSDSSRGYDSFGGIGSDDSLKECPQITQAFNVHPQTPMSQTASQCGGFPLRYFSPNATNACGNPRLG